MYHNFSSSQKRVINFCADQVHEQHASALAVPLMLNAYDYIWRQRKNAYSYTDFMRSIDHSTIVTLGMRVDPDKNTPRPTSGRLKRKFDLTNSNYRNTPVTFSHALPDKVCKHENVVSQLERWLWALTNSPLSPEEAYQYFEWIHPFADGNGRVGAILYNAVADTLADPQNPPAYSGWGQADLFQGTT